VLSEGLTTQHFTRRSPARRDRLASPETFGREAGAEQRPAPSSGKLRWPTSHVSKPQSRSRWRSRVCSVAERHIYPPVSTDPRGQPCRSKENSKGKSETEALSSCLEENCECLACRCRGQASDVAKLSTGYERMRAERRETPRKVPLSEASDRNDVKLSYERKLFQQFLLNTFHDPRVSAD
jgi:hypothetical protein